MQCGGNAWRDGVAGALPISAFEDARLARDRAGAKSQSRRAVWPFLHQLIYLFVSFDEGRVNRAVEAEDLAPLLFRTPGGGNREDHAHGSRQRIGLRVRRVCDGNSKTPDVRLPLFGVDLVVFLLGELKNQGDPVVVADALLRFEYELAA